MAATLGCNGGGAASGGTDTDTGTDTGTSTGAEALAFADFFAVAEQAYCGWATRCGAFASVEACDAVQFFDVVYPRNLLALGIFTDLGQSDVAVEYLLASYAAGRIAFDAEAAAACLAHVEARGCLQPGTFALGEDELAGQAACGRVLSGTMVENGPCLLSLECAPQDEASVVCGFSPTCADACCVGGCRTIASIPIGEACNNQRPCVEGSYCAFDQDIGAFTVCSPQKSIGAACVSADECGDDSYCNLSSGTCSGVVGVGESCNAGGSTACMAGLYCADPEQIDDYRCYAYEPVGGTCLGGWYGGCNVFGAACDEGSSTCVLRPGAGASCVDSGCALTASCDWNTDTCVALAVEGEACDHGVPCAGALRCEGWELGDPRCRAPAIASSCAVPDENQLPEGT